MMEKQTLIKETITKQQADTPACFSRFGTIVAINESTGSVRVDFDGNPFNQPLTARLGRGFRRSELQMAIDNRLNCRIEFLNDDLSLPLVTDIFSPFWMTLMNLYCGRRRWSLRRSKN